MAGSVSSTTTASSFSSSSFFASGSTHPTKPTGNNSFFRAALRLHHVRHFCASALAGKAALVSCIFRACSNSSPCSLIASSSSSCGRCNTSCDCNVAFCKAPPKYFPSSANASPIKSSSSSSSSSAGPSCSSGLATCARIASHTRSLQALPTLGRNIRANSIKFNLLPMGLFFNAKMAWTKLSSSPSVPLET